jgi:hypothetical protein
MTVTPVAFLAGVVIAFLGCCLVGHLLSQRNPYKWFTRFHAYIHPTTNVYPTASQVRALARERLDPNKIAVIVGGNSILHGMGQRGDHVWTRRLQKLLGDDYCVLNLAVFCAEPGEFGAVIAEALAAEYPRLILITSFTSGIAPNAPDGLTYRYFYYDALYKGMIPADAERDARLAEWNEQRAEREGDKIIDLCRGRRLDSLLYYQDLWTTCTLKWFNTTWCHLLTERVTAPHLVYGDVEGQVRFERPAKSAENLRIIRGLPKWLGELVFGKRALPPLGQRQKLRPNPASSPLVRRFERCFPAATRQRTLILATGESPEYIDELEPAVKAEYFSVRGKAVEVLEAAGFGALDVGLGCFLQDYVDFFHLSEQGGDKLADRVAPKVRAMARQLGYTGRD